MRRRRRPVKLTNVLLREIVQAALSLGVTGGVFYMAITGRPIAPELWAGWGLIIGFFFGGMVRQNGVEAALSKISRLSPGR